MKETWRDIQGFAGYQVSNYGQIRTHNKTTHTEFHGVRAWKDRILKPKISKKDNCSRVDLWQNGKHKTCLVHRLVAEAFLSSPIKENMTVNHKDGDRQNNSVDNLEWLSRADNIRYGFEHGQYSTCIPCVLVDKDSGEVFSFSSLSKASGFLKRNAGYISSKLKHNGAIFNTEGKLYYFMNVNFKK